jgi:hypothetical protein
LVRSLVRSTAMPAAPLTPPRRVPSHLVLDEESLVSPVAPQSSAAALRGATTPLQNLRRRSSGDNKACKTPGRHSGRRLSSFSVKGEGVESPLARMLTHKTSSAQVDAVHMSCLHTLRATSINALFALVAILLMVLAVKAMCWQQYFIAPASAHQHIALALLLLRACSPSWT